MSTRILPSEEPPLFFVGPLDDRHGGDACRPIVQPLGSVISQGCHCLPQALGASTLQVEPRTWPRQRFSSNPWLKSCGFSVDASWVLRARDSVSRN